MPARLRGMAVARPPDHNGDRFDLGTEKDSAVRKPLRGAERGASGERSVHPADLGCVDWYLYPVDRTPNLPQLKPEADLTLR